MEKIKVYNSGYSQWRESFYSILKEISEISTQTTFTKEQDEEFLKDAIVIFEYLKSGIDIKSSEILINNGEIPISCLEKTLINFSAKSGLDDHNTKSQLKKLIDYALKNGVILLYDATSNKENKDSENIKSIYEIENAKKVAIEFRRFSSFDNDKLACGYLVVPECLRFRREGNKKYNYCKIKDMLQEEMQNGNVSRKSLKRSFLHYVCL